jgi:hypothetical protein
MCILKTGNTLRVRWNKAHAANCPTRRQSVCSNVLGARWVVFSSGMYILYAYPDAFQPIELNTLFRTPLSNLTVLVPRGAGGLKTARTPCYID